MSGRMQISYDMINEMTENLYGVKLPQGGAEMEDEHE